jgi:nucleoside-diphosphate-sugar epimerase
MSIHIHLLGGSGRIGTALTQSLISDPIGGLDTIQIYCDSTKAAGFSAGQAISPKITASGYSSFCLSSFKDQEKMSQHDSHIVFNLRGVNSKQHWLNQPLDALEVQSQACKCLLDSDMWMYPGVSIVHLSSQLCDLIESPLSLEKICEGQESYRRPYMVSRLHQEAVLSAYAFEHCIPTLILRLPAVYGFSDDVKSPWVLNSLCKLRLRGEDVVPRHPERVIYLTHRQPLINYLRSLIVSTQMARDLRTVRYLRPPMLQMTVKNLADLVQALEHPTDILSHDFITITGDGNIHEEEKNHHLQLLQSSIASLLNRHG